MADPLVGKTIGKYEIVELLGRGSAAVVYKAYQPVLERHVAIKVLHPPLAADEDFLSRFQRRLQAVATLRHPRIVQVYDFDVTGDQCYVVIEFIDGYTLETQLQEIEAQNETMPLDEAIRIAQDVASLLSYAHDRGLVHRDLKPSNVMINQENQVILTDFGIAKPLNSTLHTVTGSIAGAPYYVSPERASRDPGDARSDLYSLGVTFFRMVTGQPPYDADKAAAILFQHTSGPIPIPSQINRSLSPDVDGIIVKAMAKKPGDRYQTAAEFIEHLDQVEIGATVPDTVLPAPSISPYSSPAAAATAPVSASWPTPYVLSQSHVAADPTSLPAVCDADWSRAVDHFVRGYIARWLRGGVQFLRDTHQHGLADELEPIVIRAEAIAEQVRGGSDVARNAGLEELLESLGAPPPVMDITPKKLHLPAVGVGQSGQPVTLTVTNKGRGYLSGSVVRQVLWLKTTGERFGCAAGESCEVTVEPILNSLPAGRIQSAHALLIRSVGGNHPLAAQVDILPAVLQVDVTTLDFGTVGRGEVAQTVFTLRNNGHGLMTGEIRCQVGWLAASPERFTVSSGNSLTITVRADSQAISPGDASPAGALVIASIGGQVTLDAHIQVLSPCLMVEPAQVDLGTVDLAQPGVGRNVELAVRNTGHGVLIGDVTTVADWLNVEPAAFRCQAGEAQCLRLSTTGLKVGDYRQILRVASNAGIVEAPVTLRVLFSLEPEMVCVPGGEFLRGSKEQGQAVPPSETPQCSIYLTEYWIGKHLVTNAQYAIFVEATGRQPPEHWEGSHPPEEKENHPVVNVSWWDAVIYCRWLVRITGKPYRLPTEAQWEKAARGSEGQVYPWGDEWDEQKCNTKAGGRRGTTPVGAYSPAGDSPYGCADVAGNVWEWVSDWYKKDYYARSSVFENPRGPSSRAVKVLRGGSWSSDALEARCANRAYGNRKLTSPEVGFRCALAPKVTPPRG